jgi:general stress protein YciG
MAKKPKGFGTLPQDERRLIASRGGRAVPDEKRSFSKNRELAVEAGRKGGNASRRKPGVT